MPGGARWPPPPLPPANFSSGPGLYGQVYLVGQGNLHFEATPRMEDWLGRLQTLSLERQEEEDREREREREREAVDVEMADAFQSVGLGAEAQDRDMDHDMDHGEQVGENREIVREMDQKKVREIVREDAREIVCEENVREENARVGEKRSAVSFLFLFPFVFVLLVVFLRALFGGFFLSFYCVANWLSSSGYRSEIILVNRAES
ncbi:hypothetical protein B0J18DRAFT_430735 [Chaetomium sp. MPI-SDFR-AT-0129]|nr:hypothetical protein B0J18DRAFT_430735 [Chaetomium sp. MPI-SDFR-AT-0129]